VKKIIAISLVIILIASNVGLSVNTHFCGGEAVERSLSIGIDRLSCGMPEAIKETSTSSNSLLQAKSCCEDAHQLVELDEDAETTTLSSLINVPFLVAFTTNFIAPIHFTAATTPKYAHHYPPIPKPDLQVLFQSFLI
jgi:hypothetical protein